MKPGAGTVGTWRHVASAAASAAAALTAHTACGSMAVAGGLTEGFAHVLFARCDPSSRGFVEKDDDVSP
jgi:hypothetical protein